VPETQLERGLALDADKGEAQSRVQPARRFVPGDDSRHHRVVPTRARETDQLGEHERPEPRAARAGLHVHGVFNRRAQRGLVAVGREAAVRQHPVIVDDGDDDRVIVPVARQPLPLGGRRAGLGVGRQARRLTRWGA